MFYEGLFPIYSNSTLVKNVATKFYLVDLHFPINNTV